MVDFNLLPWRAARAKYELRVLVQMFMIALVFVGCVVLGIDRYWASQAQSIEEHINRLKSELVWRQKLAQQTQVLSRATMPNKLVNFFQFINEIDAHAICFEQLKQQKNGIELIGLANTPEQLTQFLQTSSLAAYFSEVKINQLHAQNNQFQFKLLGVTHVV